MEEKIPSKAELKQKILLKKLEAEIKDFKKRKARTKEIQEAIKLFEKKIKKANAEIETVRLQKKEEFLKVKKILRDRTWKLRGQIRRLKIELKKLDVYV